MTVEKLLQYCEIYNKKLEADPKVAVIAGPNGPVDMQIIAAIVSTIQTLQKQIDELKSAAGRT